MIREMGKVKKKLKNGGKPKGHEVNTLNHHALGGHVACSTTTTHLIRSKNPRVMDSSRKPFIYYGRHDMSQQPQKLGAIDRTGEYPHLLNQTAE